MTKKTEPTITATFTHTQLETIRWALARATDAVKDAASEHRAPAFTVEKTIERMDSLKVAISALQEQALRDAKRPKAVGTGFRRIHNEKLTAAIMAAIQAVDEEV